MAKSETLEVLENEVDFLMNLLRKKKAELQNARLEIISTYLSRRVFINSDNVTIGSHDCKDSPIGICFYNNISDPAWDNCLICGEPDERS